jgi:cytoskeletal protein CcmA (bactofilin family)
MRLLKRRRTVIAEGLKIIGNVTAEGLVELNGHIEGNLHCTSLVVTPNGVINGGIQAKRVVVNGKVEGPIQGGEVILKSHAHVVGDIQHQTLAIEAGAYFEGQSVRAAPPAMRHVPDKPEVKTRREAPNNGRTAVHAA